MANDTKTDIYHIDYFDRNVSIYKILFQDKTTTLLKNVVEQVCIDRTVGRYRYPSILLTGNNSKRLIANALCNALSFKYEEVQGGLLSQGAHSGSLYNKVSTDTFYHIMSTEHCSAYTATYLYRFLSQGHMDFRNPMSEEIETVKTDNKLFVFSVTSPEGMNSDLMQYIDYHCHLDDYNSEQLEIIVEQRLKWCSIDREDMVPILIVTNSQGSIKNCINLLKVCYSLMRGDGRTKMQINDVQKGIALFFRQEKDMQIRLLGK